MDNEIFAYLQSPEGRERFAQICLEEIRSAKNVYLGGIGTLGEKRMHRVLKRAVASEEYHEIRLCDALEAQGIPYAGKNRKNVADALRDNEIFEIQTGHFRPLKSKLEWCFKNTPYDVTLIHPIIADRSLCWIDPDTGEVSEPHRGRRKENGRSIANSLYWIKDFFADPEAGPRFRLVLFYITAVEYRNRDGWSRDGKRGSSKNEVIPLALQKIETVEGTRGVAELFLEGTPEEFTASEYAKISGVKGLDTYSVLHVLEEYGYLKEDGKKGRSVIWKK